MTAPQKRRTTARSKTQKSPKVSGAGAKTSLRPRGWVRDFVSLILLASGLFLLSSIVSYVYAATQGQAHDPSGNVMGPAGHIVATLLVGSLGVVSLLPVAGLMWLAFFRNLKSVDDRPRLYGTPVVVGAGMLLVVAVSSLVAAVLKPSWSGSIGSSIASYGQARLGIGGTFVVTGLLCAVCCAVVLQRSLGDIASGVRWFVRAAVAILFVRIPIVTAKIGLVALGLLAALLKLSVPVVGKLFFSSGPYEQDESKLPLPKPKLRKNEAPVEQDDVDSEVENEEWTLGDDNVDRREEDDKEVQSRD